ncbi:PRC-barrel domain-containing protein [Thioalkalivibrio sp.]|uniref:PRC-barrel domain-containing protein n=1 Tax=Thioalkalivibrio sp. TaxID=2093813 RepID=UPI0012D5CADB|nr:PRC-barrel domain-containing protein [Thioalkalivibrio sp.]TVP78396.1 MAG: PRC-barrel domain containing protein [Thioalkalivibrio sp.]
MSFETSSVDIVAHYSYPEGAAGPLLSAGSLIGNKVCTRKGEELGDIKELMLNTITGNVCYVVLAAGGFLSMGEKLYAVPWSALTLDTPNKRFVLDVDVDRFKHAPGFDKHQWPDMADETWSKKIHSYYDLQGAPVRGATTEA